MRVTGAAPAMLVWEFGLRRSNAADSSPPPFRIASSSGRWSYLLNANGEG